MWKRPRAECVAGQTWTQVFPLFREFRVLQAVDGYAVFLYPPSATIWPVAFGLSILRAHRTKKLNTALVRSISTVGRRELPLLTNRRGGGGKSRILITGRVELKKPQQKVQSPSFLLRSGSHMPSDTIRTCKHIFPKPANEARPFGLVALRLTHELGKTRNTALSRNMRR